MTHLKRSKNHEQFTMIKMFKNLKLTNSMRSIGNKINTLQNLHRIRYNALKIIIKYIIMLNF